MTHSVIRIGTRGSALALWQAEETKRQLELVHPELQFELEIIHTKGDKILDVPLAKIGDKGLFTKELEVALLEGSIDMAVHSLKDLPTNLPKGMMLGAVMKRAEFRDAIVSSNGKTLATLDATDVVATSSLRRKSQLLQRYPNLNIVDIRGNVNTRLKKMEDGYCNVMVMAAAGLQRLGLDRYITEVLNERDFIPAVGQGAIAIEIRENDARVTEIIAPINDTQTRLAVSAERAFLNKLEGGCQVPIGCFSEVDEGGTIMLEAFIASVDGKRYFRKSVEGIHPQVVGISLADYLFSVGGKDILEELRTQ
ncbi:MAG: hypothetical protein RIS47_536 [Bacteroidota bacterium]|jgi:hydroxymethylbilane synthase